MSRSAETVLDWADGTFKFALKIEQLAELQEKTDAGPWYIQWALEAAALARLAGMAPPKDMSPAYVSETIRLGLIGGGMDPIEALRKVRAYCGPGQLSQNVTVAYAIIGVALQGAPEDEPEKKEGAGETPAKASRAAKSGSRKSTARAASSE